MGETQPTPMYNSASAQRPERASPTPPPPPDPPNEPAEVPLGRRRQGPRSNGAVVEPLWALPRLSVDRGAVARTEERGRAGRPRGQEGRENGSTTAPGTGVAEAGQCHLPLGSAKVVRRSRRYHKERRAWQSRRLRGQVGQENGAATTA